MKRDFQDKLCRYCNVFPEFREYITGIKDLEKFEIDEIITDNFEGLYMDSLFISPSKDILVNIEHQSSISDKVMFRNHRYQVESICKFLKPVHQYIFHTGLRIAPENYSYVDNQIIHNPDFKQTYRLDGNETFNKIKNKLKNNIEINSYDVFDIVWLPRFGNIKITDEFLREYVTLISQLEDNRFYSFLRIVVINWVVRLTKKEETMDHMRRELKVFEIGREDFRDLLYTAIYEREMEIRDDQIEDLTNELSKMDDELSKKDDELSKKDDELSQKDLRIRELEDKLNGKK